MVATFGVDLLDTTVDEKHGTSAAGGHTTVDGGTLDGNSQKSGLTDGVLLGVDSTDAVIGGVTVFVNGLFHLMAHIVTVIHTKRRANVTGDQDMPVTDNDAAGATTVTSGAGRDGVSQTEKIFIPTGASMCSHIALHCTEGMTERKGERLLELTDLFVLCVFSASTAVLGDSQLFRRVGLVSFGDVVEMTTFGTFQT